MNKFKILLLFLGVSLVGYSQSPITVKQGDSFTALLVFDNAYDVNRLQDISVSINRQEVAKKSTGGIVATNNVRAFRVPLSSATMRRYQGSNTLEIAVDDSILGVRRISPLTLIVSASQNGFNNGSVNTGVDATINMTISATSITTNTVLATVMKGDKGDPGDGSGGGGTSIDTTLYVRKVSGWALSQNSYTTAEKSKLAGIASGATANSTDAQLRDRSTHTGTQAQSTITNLVSDLAAKLNVADTTALLRKTTAAGLYQTKGNYLTSINSSQVTTALGFTPYNATNPNDYITSSALSPYLTTSAAASTYQPILTSGTTIKTINGASLLGSGNIVISGSGTAIDTTLFLQKTTAAGLYQPKGSYLTSINSGQVTTALGYTPYNATNPSGYITNSALAVKADTLSVNSKLETVSSISALQAYTKSNFAYFDGSTWEKKSGNVSSNGGSAAGTLIRVSSSVYWGRKFDGSANVKWFGAAGGGVTDESDAFSRALTYLNSKGGGTLIIETGIYNAGFNNKFSNITFQIVGNVSVKQIWHIACGSGPDVDIADPNYAASISYVENVHLKGTVKLIDGGRIGAFYAKNCSMGDVIATGNNLGIHLYGYCENWSVGNVYSAYMLQSSSMTGAIFVDRFSNGNGQPKNVKIQSIVAKNNYYNGAYLDVDGLTVNEITADTSGLNGVRLYLCKNVTIGKIKATNSGSYSTVNLFLKSGLLIEGSQNVTIEQVYVSYSGYHNVYLNGLTNNNINIANIVSEYSLNDGIHVASSNCYLGSVVANNNTENGLTISSANNVTVEKSRTFLNTVTGVWVTGSSTNIQLETIETYTNTKRGLLIGSSGTYRIGAIKAYNNTEDNVLVSGLSGFLTIGALEAIGTSTSNYYSALSVQSCSGIINIGSFRASSFTGTGHNAIYGNANTGVINIGTTLVSGATNFLNLTTTPNIYFGSNPVLSGIVEASSLNYTVLGYGKGGYSLPRMTTTQRNAISGPATGLIVYCTDCTSASGGTGELQQYNGTSWLSVGSVGTANGILTANGSGTVSAATTTGSGNVVLATSPTLITPALGVPQSGDFSTGTFTWPTFNQNTTGVASNVSGTVAVANGGTGATTVGQARTNLGLGTLATQSGTFSGSSSGTNTGDQTITLIGDVTGSGTGSFSATIANGSVTLPKMANVASGVILGRTTAATGVVEALSGSQVKTLIGLGAAENTAMSTWAGSSNITTLGTIGTGVWDGTAIADGKIATALTGKTYNGLTIPSTTGTLAITNGKTLTASNTITLSGTDGSTFNIGSGGSLANYALLASPALTGVPTAPTATAGTNTTQVATTAYVEDAKNKTLESIQVAFSDETTAITTGNGKLTFYMPYAFTVTEVFLAVKTPQSSGAVFTVDINEEGVSILSTKLTLDNTETKSSTAATAAVVSDTSLAKWATMTIDIDQSSGIAVGGKIIINGYRQ